MISSLGINGCVSTDMHIIKIQFFFIQEDNQFFSTNTTIITRAVTKTYFLPKSADFPWLQMRLTLYICLFNSNFSKKKKYLKPEITTYKYNFFALKF